MNERKPVLHAITGIRGIACLFIVCFHYYCLNVDDPGLGMEALPFGEQSKFFFVYSMNAVELFFLLAGFLTAYHYRERIADMSFPEYFKKHYGKLLIPSLVVNLWALVNELRLPSSSIPISPVRFLLSTLMVNTGWFTPTSQTGLPINSTMWFIDVLLLCYLLYFAVGKLTRNSYAYLCVCTLMVLIGWVCLDHTPQLPFLWSLDGRGYAPFFLGVLLSEFQKDADEALRKKVTSVWCALVAGLFAVRLVLGFEAIFGDVGTQNYVRYFEFVLAPCMVLAALNLSPVTKLLSCKPLVWLGALSTAIYYVHNNVMQDYILLNHAFGDPVNFSAWPVFLLVLISVIPFAVLLRFALEKLERMLSPTQG